MASASEQGTASAEQDETAAKTEQNETSSNTEQDETTPKTEQDETTAKEEGGSPAGEEQGADPAGDSAASDDQGEDQGSGEEEDDGASGASIAGAIEDVSSLPGETVNDQDGRKVGQVKEIYALGEDEAPMWVTIESATGLGRTRDVFVPLARIKKQGDEIRVPYSFDHLHDSPDIEPGDEVSEEDDRALRTYYAIGLADQELVQSARSYASQVPEGEGSAQKVDADSVDGPARELDDTPPAERVAEAYEKQKEEEGEEHRKGRDATADQVFEEEGSGEDDEQSDSEEEPKSEDKEKQPEAQEKTEEKDGEGGEG